MWRAFFLALGIYACILGLECLALDRAVLHAREPAVGRVRVEKRRELKPAEWTPWSLLSAGAVTILYSFTIPGRVVQEVKT